MAPQEDRAVAPVDEQPGGIYLRTIEQLAGPEGQNTERLRRRRGRGWAVGGAACGAALLAVIALYWKDDPAPRPAGDARAGADVPSRRTSALDPPRIIRVAPRDRKVRIRVGEERRFEIEALGDDLFYRWSVDGKPVGSEGAVVYRPDRTQVGRRRLEVAIFGATGTRSRLWAVRVDGPRRPRITASSPPGGTVEATIGSFVRFTVKTRPGSDGTVPRIAWLLDGVGVGSGESFVLRPERPGTVRLQAVATADDDTRIGREWLVAVPAPLPPPESQVAAAPPERSPVPERRDPVPAREDTASVRTDTVAATPPTSERGGTGVSRQEIERLLERYAEAWRRHDVAELQRIGQVTTASQAQALSDYFRRTGEIEVEVRLLDLEEVEGGVRVRFTRRDRFRDPLGRVVSKESPPLEKLVSRSGDGLRFAAAPR